MDILQTIVNQQLGLGRVVKEEGRTIFKPNFFFRQCALMEKAVAVSYTAPLRYSQQMYHDKGRAKSSPELHPDHRDGANRMGRASSQCRSQYPRPSACCAAGGSGEVKWRPINISIKDKHFRVRQLLKEDAGSGVRADDSGVGVFIIFVNIMT